MTTYTIEEVNERNEYEGAYGPMTGYTLTLIGVPEQVGLNQKRDTPAPTAGQELDLELAPYSEDEIRRYPPNANRLKAKKVQQAGMFGPRPEDPARSRAILRQHSQDMAIQLIRLALEFNIITQDHRPGSGSELFGLVKTMAEYFDADVRNVRDVG